MNILIVEDDEIQLNSLENIVLGYKTSKYSTSQTIFKALSFSEATSLYTENNIDLFFIDIVLETDSADDGLSLAENIRKLPNYRTTPIIFITAYTAQIFKAINSIHCFSYITKPYNSSDVYNAISDIEHKFLHTNDNLIVRDERNIYYNIKFNSIIYIENSMHRAIIHTINGDFKHLSHTLDSILTVLDQRFIRIHKKYVINTEYIKNYDKSNRLLMLSYTIHDNKTVDNKIWDKNTFHSNKNRQLPIGRNYKKAFENIFLIV